jgi:hypothetical protein
VSRFPLDFGLVGTPRWRAVYKYALPFQPSGIHTPHGEEDNNMQASIEGSYKMCGRQVTLVPILQTDTVSCMDCGAPARTVVLEANNEEAWTWCGICAVG